MLGEGDASVISGVPPRAGGMVPAVGDPALGHLHSWWDAGQYWLDPCSLEVHAAPAGPGGTGGPSLGAAPGPAKAKTKAFEAEAHTGGAGGRVREGAAVSSGEYEYSGELEHTHTSDARFVGTATASFPDVTREEHNNSSANHSGGAAAADTATTVGEAGKTARARAKQRQEPHAQQPRACYVHGCAEAANSSRRFFSGGTRLSLCEKHMRASQLVLEPDGDPLRVCFYCHRLHPLDEFDPGVRSVCRKKNQLRLEARKRKGNAKRQDAAIKKQAVGNDAHAKGAGGPTGWGNDAPTDSSFSAFNMGAPLATPNTAAEEQQRQLMLTTEQQQQRRRRQQQQALQTLEALTTIDAMQASVIPLPGQTVEPLFANGSTFPSARHGQHAGVLPSGFPAATTGVNDPPQPQVEVLPIVPLNPLGDFIAPVSDEGVRLRSYYLQASMGVVKPPGLRSDSAWESLLDQYEAVMELQMLDFKLHDAHPTDPAFSNLFALLKQTLGGAVPMATEALMLPGCVNLVITSQVVKTKSHYSESALKAKLSPAERAAATLPTSGGGAWSKHWDVSDGVKVIDVQGDVQRAAPCVEALLHSAAPLCVVPGQPFDVVVESAYRSSILAHGPTGLVEAPVRGGMARIPASATASIGNGLLQLRSDRRSPALPILVVDDRTVAFELAVWSTKVAPRLGLALRGRVVPDLAWLLRADAQGWLISDASLRAPARRVATALLKIAEQCGELPSVVSLLNGILSELDDLQGSGAAQHSNRVPRKASFNTEVSSELTRSQFWGPINMMSSYLAPHCNGLTAPMDAEERAFREWALREQCFSRRTRWLWLAGSVVMFIYYVSYVLIAQSVWDFVYFACAASCIVAIWCTRAYTNMKVPSNKVVMLVVWFLQLAVLTLSLHYSEADSTFCQRRCLGLLTFDVPHKLFLGLAFLGTTEPTLSQYFPIAAVRLFAVAASRCYRPVQCGGTEEGIRVKIAVELVSILLVEPLLCVYNSRRQRAKFVEARAALKSE